MSLACLHSLLAVRTVTGSHPPSLCYIAAVISFVVFAVFKNPKPQLKALGSSIKGLISAVKVSRSSKQ